MLMVAYNSLLLLLLHHIRTPTINIMLLLLLPLKWAIALNSLDLHSLIQKLQLQEHRQLEVIIITTITITQDLRIWVILKLMDIVTDMPLHRDNSSQDRPSNQVEVVEEAIINTIIITLHLSNHNTTILQARTIQLHHQLQLEADHSLMPVDLMEHLQVGL